MIIALSAAVQSCRHSWTIPRQTTTLLDCRLPHVQVSAAEASAISDSELCQLLHDHFHVETEQLLAQLMTAPPAAQKANGSLIKARRILFSREGACTDAQWSTPPTTVPYMSFQANRSSTRTDNRRPLHHEIWKNYQNYEQSAC